ncbi:uncharacterized protein BO80DRAFT_436262 [Aspergillus ibericus CBS 121593]|uniref:Uncharacterized protein n=1 Tax=Aspergillus ibericus CBS 121593 TaxID=1448316 RepID=A0A395GWJ1_9EURO|nr:hypothetical protein BO80DRAFT_436262 [Aspergillus ibericus CBS 121593]RAK99388.1 hypothetical protein BO80DRAFT_436262 [Aspergillus ibericus CBS 121593]
MDDIIDHMDQDVLLPPTTTPSLTTSLTPTTTITRKRRTRDPDDESDSDPICHSHIEPPTQKRPRLPSPFRLQAERLEEALNREIQAQEDEITMHRYRMLNQRALNEAQDRLFKAAMFPGQVVGEEYYLQLRRWNELQKREEIGNGDGVMDVDGDGDGDAERGDGYGDEDGEEEDMVVSSTGATVSSSPLHLAQHVPAPVLVPIQGQQQDAMSPMKKKGCLTGLRDTGGMGNGSEFAIYEDQETEDSAGAYALGINYHEVRSYRDWDEDKENIEEEDELPNGIETEIETETERFLQVDVDQDMEGNNHGGGVDEEELEYADTELDPSDEALGDQMRRRRYYSLRRQRRQFDSHARAMSATEIPLNPSSQRALGREGSQDVGVGQGRRGTRRLAQRRNRRENEWGKKCELTETERYAWYNSLGE